MVSLIRFSAGILLLCIASVISSSNKHLNIALHAQVNPLSGNIVGSVLTTDGLKAAFQLRPEVAYVNIYYPFTYEGFFLIQWDVVIMEGWFFMIHEFIQLVRSHSPGTISSLILLPIPTCITYSPLLLSLHEPYEHTPLTTTTNTHTSYQSRTGVIILYYCLDPVFPGLDDLTSFDVDGYLTNSEVCQTVHVPVSSNHSISHISPTQSQH